MGMSAVVGALAMLVMVAAAAGGKAAAPGGTAAAPGGEVDRRILPKPYPAPALPAAGDSFTDPTFGSTIVRLTDRATAPGGAGVNSAAQDTMFNSDTSLFYLLYKSNGGTWIYDLDRRGVVTRLGQLPAWASGDGAAWDPQRPNRLFVVLMSRQSREVWQLEIERSPWRVKEAKHFAFPEVPPGGYPYSRVQVSPDGRYVAVIASSFGVQDEYDHIVVWDGQTGTKRVVKTSTRPGVMSLMHSAVMDTSGEYLIVEGVPWGKSWIYHWPTDRFSRALTTAEGFGGHKAPGFKEILHPGREAGQWMRRSLADPEEIAEIFRWPPKDGKGDWYEDSHSTKVGPRGFVQSRYVSGGFPPFYNQAVLHAGAIWKVQNFRAQHPQVLPPDFFEYDGVRLPKVDGIPRASGQWSYDAQRDILYFWLPDSANPKTTAKNLKIADWRPLMEEVVRLYRDGSGRWRWQRLAHHRSQNRNFGEIPRANLSPDGKWALFQSNWDGSPHTDAFLLSVQDDVKKAMSAPEMEPRGWVR
jgi:hypothetical protein